MRNHPALIHLIIRTTNWQMNLDQLDLANIEPNRSVLHLTLIWYMNGEEAESDFELDMCLPLIRYLPSLQHIRFRMLWKGVPDNYHEFARQRFNNIRVFLIEQVRPLCPDFVGCKLVLSRFTIGGNLRLVKTMLLEEDISLSD